MTRHKSRIALAVILLALAAVSTVDSASAGGSAVLYKNGILVGLVGLP